MMIIADLLLCLKLWGGLTPVEFVPYAKDILRCLSSWSWRVNIEALKVLGRLTTAELAVYSIVIVGCLSSRSWMPSWSWMFVFVVMLFVRFYSWCRLTTAELANYSIVIVGCLSSRSWMPSWSWMFVFVVMLFVRLYSWCYGVKIEALKQLSTLTPFELAPHAKDISGCLSSCSRDVKMESLKLLDGLKATDLAPHVKDIVGCLSSWSSGVKREALKILVRLAPIELAPFAKDILGCFSSWSSDVKLEALKVLSTLAPLIELAPHAKYISGCLSSWSRDVKIEALKLLGGLTPIQLAPNTKDILRCLSSWSHDVKVEARKLLGRLAPIELAPHAKDILGCLSSWSRDVKIEALKQLGRLTSIQLAPHVKDILVCLSSWSCDVKIEALRVLGTLTPVELAPHVKDILRYIASSSPVVKRHSLAVLHSLRPSNRQQSKKVLSMQIGALQLLDRLTPVEIAPHVKEIFGCLGLSQSDVQTRALRLLGRFAPAELAPHIKDVLRCLAISSSHVNSEARKLLGRLAPVELAPQVKDILECLSSESRVVKIEALTVLGRLAPNELVPHLKGILQCLHSWPEDVQVLALQKLLGGLTPIELAPHAQDILGCLSSWPENVQIEALKLFGRFGPSELAPHLEGILGCLFLRSNDLRIEALKLLGMFAPIELAPHAKDILQCLSSCSRGACGVKFEALKLLGGLTPIQLAPHATYILRCLSSWPEDVQIEALKLFDRFGPSELAPYLEDILGCLSSRSEGVQIEGLKILSILAQLIPTELAPHVKDILKRLSSCAEHVQIEALKLLGRLTPVVLAPHVKAILGCIVSSSPAVRQQSLSVLHSLGSSNLQEYCTWKDSEDNSALHIAASLGDVNSCDLLTRAGFPNKVRNIHGELPVDRAKKNRHSDVVDFFTQNEHLSATRVGAGDAWEQAIADTRYIASLAWYTMPLQGFVGRCGGLHSLIHILVQGSDSSHAYVIEKAERLDDQTDQFKNGIHVSNWVDIGPKLGSPWKTLEGDSVARDKTFSAVWQIAVSTGPYNLGTSNCHHAAREIFNACAKKHARTLEMPNKIATRTAHVFSTLGVPVERFGRSTSCTSPSSEMLHCESQSTSYESIFPMSAPLVRLNNQSHADTIMAAKLSAWIYDAHEVDQPHIHFHNSFGEMLAIYIEETQEEKRLHPGTCVSMKVPNASVKIRVNKIGLLGLTSRRTRLLRFEAQHSQKYRIVLGHDGSASYEQGIPELLPEEASVKVLHVLDHDNVVQWAIVTVADTAFIVFKGTSEIGDHLINGSFLTCDAHGLRVHCGMWHALQQTRHHTFKLIRDHLGSLSNATNIVICGHSLGGGYAMLTALELFSSEFAIKAVLTFGAPQVVVPDFGNELWNKLNDTTTLYVNSYDLVPRLPSYFMKWTQSVHLCSPSRPLAFRLDLSRFYKKYTVPETLLSDFDTVGSLMFLRLGSSMAKLVASTDESHKEILSRLPDQMGPFILTQHEMSEYLKILSVLVQ